MGIWVSRAATAAFILALSAGVANADQADSDGRVAAITGAILQADGPKALQLLAGSPDGQPLPESAFRTCTIKRLSAEPPSEVVTSPRSRRPDRFAADVLKTYRAYWQAATMAPDKRDAAEKLLNAKLDRMMGLAPSAPMDAAERAVAQRLRRLGFYSLEGRTGLLRELMLWSKQTSKTYTVQLPEGVNETQVVFMDGFYSLGWSSYLSCDHTGTGGWTKPDGLYVVVPAYKSFTDENFRVNFLAHESQHYLDHRQFPNLASWELEYRAKLVEVGYADETMRKTLVRFASDQGDDPASPHSYADKKVLSALRLRLDLSPDGDLTGVSVARLHEAALDELRSDSARRRSQAQGAPKLP